MTKLRLRVRRADTISVDKTNQLRDLCPHPRRRRRPNTAGDARALTIVAALVRAPRRALSLASRRFLARVMWISPEGSVRAYVWSFFQFVVNLLKFNFSDPCIIMIYTDKMFPEDFENHPTYYARRYVQAQPQEPPRSRVRSLKPLSNQVSFHYLICRGSTVNHIRTIGTF